MALLKVFANVCGVIAKAIETGIVAGAELFFKLCRYCVILLGVIVLLMVILILK